MMRFTAGLAIAALIASGAAASAESYQFGVLNKSKLVADGFRTKESGSWSSNWLNTKIRPGESWTLDFGHADGQCTVRTQIHFTDNTYFDYDVDYCKATNLYIYENEVQYD